MNICVKFAFLIVLLYAPIDGRFLIPGNNWQHWLVLQEGRHSGVLGGGVTLRL